MAYREYVVTDEAVVQAKHVGIMTNVRSRVTSMARSAAPYRHPRCNRRYRRFIMLVEGVVITRVERVDGKTL